MNVYAIAWLYCKTNLLLISKTVLSLMFSFQKVINLTIITLSFIYSVIMVS